MILRRRVFNELNCGWILWSNCRLRSEPYDDAGWFRVFNGLVALATPASYEVAFALLCRQWPHWRRSATTRAAVLRLFPVQFPVILAVWKPPTRHVARGGSLEFVQSGLSMKFWPTSA